MPGSPQSAGFAHGLRTAKGTWVGTTHHSERLTTVVRQRSERLVEDEPLFLRDRAVDVLGAADAASGESCPGLQRPEVAPG